MPEYEEFLAQIREVLAPLAKAGQTIDDNTELAADLGLSSLQVLELIEKIEDRFDMSIPLNILPYALTIKDLYEQMRKLSPDQA